MEFAWHHRHKRRRQRSSGGGPKKGPNALGTTLVPDMQALSVGVFQRPCIEGQTRGRRVLTASLENKEKSTEEKRRREKKRAAAARARCAAVFWEKTAPRWPCGSAFPEKPHSTAPMGKTMLWGYFRLCEGLSGRGGLRRFVRQGPAYTKASRNHDLSLLCSLPDSAWAPGPAGWARLFQIIFTKRNESEKSVSPYKADILVIPMATHGHAKRDSVTRPNSIPLPETERTLRNQCGSIWAACSHRHRSAPLANSGGRRGRVRRGLFGETLLDAASEREEKGQPL